MLGNRGNLIFWMLISAGLFAYFGWAGSWTHRYTNTQPSTIVPMVVILMWTLRGGSVAFILSAIATAFAPFIGIAMFCAFGLITAILFVIVGIWEMTNPHGFYSGIPSIFLFLFAAMNGFFSIGGLLDAFRERRALAAATAAADDADNNPM